MEAELLRRVREDDPGLRHDQRLVRVIADPWTFEGIAAIDDLPAQIAGLARGAAQFLEPLVIGFELVIGNAPVLYREIGGDSLLAVALFEMRAQHEFAWKVAPGDAVPMGARAADAIAQRKRAPAAHGKRRLVGGVAYGESLGAVIQHELEAQPGFQLVADARQREIL